MGLELDFACNMPALVLFLVGRVFHLLVRPDTGGTKCAAVYNVRHLQDSVLLGICLMLPYAFLDTYVEHYEKN